MDWTSNFWIILTGVLVGASCGLVGSFLVLRRMAMLGDAISHAVLPGIVIAFLLSGQREPLFMLLGAAAVGLGTTFLVQSLEGGGVQSDAAIGIVFTALFALGVVLISLYAGQVDLDQDCVLFGEIAYVPWDTLEWGGNSWGPRAVWMVGGSLIINLIVLGLFFKQFKLCAFDPGLAAAVGVSVAFFHYLLMGLVSLTTVSAFESVGAILVVAMLIVPGATAYLFTDRLNVMLAGSMGVGALSAVGGFFLASALNCSIAGAMTVAAGALFTIALLAAPRKGMIARRLAQRSLQRRIAEEDALLLVYRWTEQKGAIPATVEEIGSLQKIPQAGTLPRALARLVSRALLARSNGRYVLTDAGREQARTWMRRHRVYETYLDQLGHPPDSTHEQAHTDEHFLSPELTDALSQAAEDPRIDPSGKPIPEPTSED